MCVPRRGKKMQKREAQLRSPVPSKGVKKKVKKGLNHRVKPMCYRKITEKLPKEYSRITEGNITNITNII